MDENYYTVLQLSSSATQKEIKHAYRRLVRTHHPDITLRDDKEYIKIINVAYETLSNPEKKMAYDKNRQGLYHAQSRRFNYQYSPYKYSAWYKERKSKSTDYTYSLKTKIIGWGATLFIITLIAFGIRLLYDFTSEYYYKKGLAAEKSNHTREALYFYQLAIRDWGGKSVEASIKSAELSAKMNAFDKMIFFCEKGLSYDPDTMQLASLYYLKGIAYYKAKQYKKSTHSFLKSLTFNFNKDIIYKELGWIYINHLSMYEHGKEIYTYLLANQYSPIKYYYYRGICYQNLKSHKKAISDFLIYLTKYPLDGKALKGLSESYLALNNQERACYYFKLAQQKGIEVSLKKLNNLCK